MDGTPADYGRSEPDISDLPEPDISDLPVPDTPQARQKAFEENDRQTRISHAITDTRGVIKGAASLLTAPADLGIGLVNQIKRYAYGADASTLDTNASDLLEKGLASVGLKEQKDSGLREAIMGLGGGALAAGEGAISQVANDANVGRFWRWAGPAGSANRQVLNNATAQWIGVPGATKLTSDVLAQADTQAKRLLDIGRNADNILMFHPQTVGSGVLQAAIDAGYPTAAAGEFTKNTIVTRLLETLEKGDANGEELGNLASQLGAEAKAKISSDHTLGSALFNTKSFVESLISEGLTPDEQRLYTQGSQYWKRLHGQLLSNPNVIVSGDLDGENMVNLLKSKDVRGYVLGQNPDPFYDMLHKVEDTMSIGSGLDRQGVNHMTNFVAPVVKALARAVPQAVQVFNQRGLGPALRLAANKPGFLAAAAQEIEKAKQQPVTGAEQ